MQFHKFQSNYYAFVFEDFLFCLNFSQVTSTDHLKYSSWMKALFQVTGSYW